MRKQEFHYTSTDGIHRIHGIEWVPDDNLEIRGVLQISHGMVEYIDRYDEFARYLTERGFVVLGNDHLGHGGSVNDESEYGYFGQNQGNQFVIGDIHKLRRWGQSRYPNIPYFLLGHSMGSFLLRQYMLTYSDGIAGAIVMGTAFYSKIMLHGGQMLCQVIESLRGPYYRSRILSKFSFDIFNSRFEPSPTKSKRDWITTDAEKLKEYLADPLCNFTFTVNGFYSMFEGMLHLNSRKMIRKIDHELPILFVSGKEDPVGGFGKDVEKVYGQYEQEGFTDVRCVLYEGMRHEVLNEVDREQVYEDLYQWLSERCEKYEE